METTLSHSMEGLSVSIFRTLNAHPTCRSPRSPASVAWCFCGFTHLVDCSTKHHIICTPALFPWKRQQCWTFLPLKVPKAEVHFFSELVCKSLCFFLRKVPLHCIQKGSGEERKVISGGFSSITKY